MRRRRAAGGGGEQPSERAHTSAGNAQRCALLLRVASLRFSLTAMRPTGEASLLTPRSRSGCIIRSAMPARRGGGRVSARSGEMRGLAGSSRASGGTGRVQSDLAPLAWPRASTARPRGSALAPRSTPQAPPDIPRLFSAAAPHTAPRRTRSKRLGSARHNSSALTLEQRARLQEEGRDRHARQVLAGHQALDLRGGRETEARGPSARRSGARSSTQQ